jgi:hypothetical protein
MEFWWAGKANFNFKGGIKFQFKYFRGTPNQYCENSTVLQQNLFRISKVQHILLTPNIYLCMIGLQFMTLEI